MMTCDYCGKQTDSFGDVNGSIVCSTCMGWDPGSKMREDVRAEIEVLVACDDSIEDIEEQRY